jgi:hypothetical protein
MRPNLNDVAQRQKREMKDPGATSHHHTDRKVRGWKPRSLAAKMAAATVRHPAASQGGTKMRPKNPRREI